MLSLRMTGAVGLLSAILATACADSSPSFLPTAPSALNSASATSQVSDQSGTMATLADSNGVMGNGHGNGNGGGGNPNANSGGGNGNGNPNPNAGNGPPSQTPGPPATKKVELEGLIEAVSAGSLTVDGQVVLVPLTVVVHHGSKVIPLADLAVGDRVHVKATLDNNVLTAVDVKVQNPGGGNGNGNGNGSGSGSGTEIEVDGLVSALGVSACPNLTFTLGTQAVSTNSATVFSGGTCNVIVNGSHVTVTGVVQSGTLVAGLVTIF